MQLHQAARNAGALVAHLACAFPITDEVSLQAATALADVSEECGGVRLLRECKVAKLGRCQNSHVGKLTGRACDQAVILVPSYMCSTTTLQTY